MARQLRFTNECELIVAMIRLFLDRAEDNRTDDEADIHAEIEDMFAELEEASARYYTPGMHIEQRAVPRVPKALKPRKRCRRITNDKNKME